MAVYFYKSDSGDGWRNLAVDRFFFEHLSRDDLLFYLYVNDGAVVIGKGQNAWRECRLDAMERDGIQLVRRHTGGGAVFHDRGNLNFSFVAGESGYSLDRQLGVIKRAVSSFGLAAELSGRNDLLVDGKKFSGNAFASSGGRMAHHGTLLIDTDSLKLEKYLRVSAEKMAAKGIRSVVSRVCPLSALCPSLTVSLMAERLLAAFREEYGPFTEYCPDASGREEIERLYKIQSSWEWRFGQTPEFDRKLERRFSFGEMQLLFRVKHGAVCGVKVYSDALDPALPGLVEKCLLGARFTQEGLSERLLSEAARGRRELSEIAEYLSSEIL